MRALFAAMQLRIALRAVGVEIGSGGQGCRAIETSCCCDVLHQPGKAGPGNVNRRAWPVGFGPILAAMTVGLAVRVHIPSLSVFAIAVHGEGYSKSLDELNIRNET